MATLEIMQDLFYKTTEYMKVYMFLNRLITEKVRHNQEVEPQELSERDLAFRTYQTSLLDYHRLLKRMAAQRESSLLSRRAA